MNITSPTRAQHTYRQHLVAPPEKVFPLLCPVREAEWAVGWNPTKVVSTSGFAERDCVFTTPAANGETIWYVTRHEPANLFVEMLKITPGMTACRLEIQLLEDPTGCLADITYSHTSLGPAGDEFVASFTPAYYQEFMREWENELNYYLQHGRIFQKSE